MTAAILLLGLCVVASSAEASCLFGDDCLFPCRCQDEAECNPNMGTCSECMDGLPRPNNQPDRFKWRGAACQTGNVAYNKTTKQSGVYQEFVSSKGVDGIIGSLSSETNCAHTENDVGVAAWFYVDLESVHQIHNVTVYNTFNSGGYFKMVDFSIRVGNTSDVDEHAECAHYGEEAVVELFIRSAICIFGTKKYCVTFQYETSATTNWHQWTPVINGHLPVPN
ncbi:hypothetical protein CAPTEDRAFT_210452 [Capitella teleta]|uniref:Fucolectin tachylectin-4 pentraxin-1 domain-containing protein n=1 Tax=Capitella teleta TaxID=283909 RepID=R7V4X0_CAPTE|nr:hypothetical protein CAPTEDRAFT_210452 [Capitella teleta]|eukprot:ELU13507.1 hypothetical protein CAPTEDRAFT_210452 [Capitella teleta]